MTAPADTTARLDLAFPAIWLRDNCPCEDCRDPRSGQKLFDITDLAADLAVTSIDEGGNRLVVEFDDGHRSVFDRAWIEAQRRRSGDGTGDHDGDGDGRTEQDKKLWTGSDLRGALPEADWATYLRDDAERLRTLAAVQRLGFAILHGTPVADRTVVRIADTFGYVRVTNYGELFDVRVEPDPINLAFTGLAVSPHTDNPYRDPVPTMQLLHCLANAVDGGESGLVDGFMAASILRDQNPTAFRTLTSTPVPFAWSDGATSLAAERPLIDVDGRGRIREVRFNNRSMQPVALTPDDIVAFYAAYRAFAEIVKRPDLLLTFRLEPGDCVIFDNVRLLHARTAFSDSGEGLRHLQGCYADIDGLHSTITRLRSQA